MLLQALHDIRKEPMPMRKSVYILGHEWLVGLNIDKAV